MDQERRRGLEKLSCKGEIASENEGENLILKIGTQPKLNMNRPDVQVGGSMQVCIFFPSFPYDVLEALPRITTRRSDFFINAQVGKRRHQLNWPMRGKQISKMIQRIERQLLHVASYG